MWRKDRYRLEYIVRPETASAFLGAPGDRGTEIHEFMEKTPVEPLT